VLEAFWVSRPATIRATADQRDGDHRAGRVYGLVTQIKGFEHHAETGRPRGFPQQPVFADFDSKGQTSTVSGAFWIPAAFKGGIERSVINDWAGCARDDLGVVGLGIADPCNPVALGTRIKAVLTTPRRKSEHRGKRN